MLKYLYRLLRRYDWVKRTDSGHKFEICLYVLDVNGVVNGWCKENLKGKYESRYMGKMFYIPARGMVKYYQLFFYEEESAMACKLRWDSMSILNRLQNLK